MLLSSSSFATCVFTMQESETNRLFGILSCTVSSSSFIVCVPVCCLIFDYTWTLEPFPVNRNNVFSHNSSSAAAAALHRKRLFGPFLSRHSTRNSCSPLCVSNDGKETIFSRALLSFIKSKILYYISLSFVFLIFLRLFLLLKNY